jgi:peptidoglycan hydrolase CwlO-like protein
MIRSLVLATALLAAAISPALAEMTPKEQMLAVAIQGEEASIRAATEGMTMIRAALEALVRDQDVQIKDLQAQIAKLKEPK